MASRYEDESRRSSDEHHHLFAPLAEDDEKSVGAARKSLLGPSADYVHNKRWTHVDQDEDEDESTAYCINRWWKLLLFLVFWTVLLPITVNWMHRKPPTPGVTGIHGQPPKTRPAEDFVLDADWDFHAVPQLREYRWTIEDVEFNPDGVYRPMLLINNQFPGPLVRVNEHDTLRVTVINNASNATSIHWHGIYQNGTNYMDGTVGITQCPIAPGSSFTYEFTLEGQSGTYWYHGHQGVQASDGLVGPLIVHAKNEKQLQMIDYSTDRVVMVSDHYHDLSGALTRQYLAPDRENAEPVPDGALINGRSIRDCSTLPHRKCDNTTSNVGRPTFDLEPSQHHRLRIINVGAFAEIQFQVDEHELAVTEVDGTDVYPRTYHRLNVNPAQRYSVIIHTNVTGPDSFWLRARMIPTCFAEPNPDLEVDSLAIIRYTHTSSPEQTLTPSSLDWSEALWLECRDLNTTELVPVKEIAAPSTPDAYYYLRSNFEIGDWQLSRGVFNSSSFRPDLRSPTLLRTVDGLHSSNASFDPVTTSSSSHTNSQGSVFVNDIAFHKPRELVVQSFGIQTIDLLIHNFDDGNHPFHLHGYKFFVLAQGHGAPPHTDPFGDLTFSNLAPTYSSLDLSNPLRRDTASVEAFGWTLIRFVADNPGVWAFHCHVSWHAEAGLVMQFATRTDLLASMQMPKEHLALCNAPVSELEKGAAPKDEVYFGYRTRD